MNDLNGQVESLIERLDSDKLIYLLDTLTAKAARQLKYLHEMDTLMRGWLMKAGEFEDKRRRALIMLTDTLMQMESVQPLIAIADELDALVNGSDELSKWAKLQEENESERV